MNQTEYPLELTVNEASKLLKSSLDKVRVLDVREPHELEICRIEGAQVIPMRQIPAQAATLPRDQHILVLCHHGNRSRRVTEYLRAQGFSAVSNIAGGIEAWAEQVDPSLARY